jgi:hypothetical protein
MTGSADIHHRGTVLSLAALRSHARRAAEHVVDRFDGDGWARDTCRSRVLESALLLALLRRTDTAPTVQGGLANFLTHRPLAAGRSVAYMEDIIAEGALCRPDDNACRGAEASTVLGHEASPRKFLLINAVLALLQLVPYRRDIPITYGQYAVWTNLSLCAIKVLRGDGTPADRAYLMSELGRTNGAWEGNLLAQLVALHAVATFQPESAQFRTGLTAVIDRQQADGGIPFVSGQEVFITALAALALHRTGRFSDLVIAAADAIAGAQHADGGWGYTLATSQSDVDDTSRCVEFLHAVAGPTDAREASTLRAGEDYLLGMIEPDGGFSTYIRGHGTEADMTAGALIALSRRWNNGPPELQAATQALVTAQRPNGTFATGWSLSQPSVMLRAVDATGSLSRLRPPLTAHTTRLVARCAAWLVNARTDNGLWRRDPGTDSDVLATAQAITALIRACDSTAIVRESMTSLVARQRDDGGFDSLPDQAGPRPFPFHFPLLTTVHALDALTSFLHKEDHG